MNEVLITENQLHHRLQEIFGFPYVTMAGRMRSCITAIYETILSKRSDIPCLLPSNVCPTLLMALLDSGANVTLIDVDLSTGAADDAQMAQIINEHDAPGIVMLVQNHGYLREFEKTFHAARSQNWIILENDTMAVRCNGIFGKSMSKADILLTSFGDGKGISTGIGGAAFFQSQQLFDKVSSRISTYPKINLEALKRDKWLIHMRRLMRSGPSNGESQLKHSAFLLNFEAGELRHSFPSEFTAKIYYAVEKLEENSVKKIETYQNWLSAFDQYDLKPCLLDGEIVNPSRFVFRIVNNRDSIVQHLRENDIDVGTNSPDVREFFPGHNFNKAKETTRLWTKEVVNLWLTEDYDKKKIDRSVSIIASVGI